MGIYLDNAATSWPKAPGVGNAMKNYIDNVGVNTGRGTYFEAAQAGVTVLETREALKKLFNFSGNIRNVVLTPGVTFAANQVLRGFLRPGDHVLVSSMEHNAVMRPIMDLSVSGVEFSRIPADKDGISDIGSVPGLIRDNTRLVMVSHASNVSGTVFPLKELADICRELGIPLAVDAAQTAGHLNIDFDGLGLSALCVPGHKGLLGPQGIGAMLLSDKFAAGLMPIVTGGTGSASDSEEQPDFMPDKFESGTLNLPGVYGLKKALDFIISKGTDELARHEMALTERFMDKIEGANVRIAGTKDINKRVGVVSLDFLRCDNAEAAFKLEQDFGILTRCGLHCAPNAHKTLGTFPQGTVRFSVGYKTTEEEIDAAAEAVLTIAGGK